MTEPTFRNVRRVSPDAIEYERANGERVVVQRDLDHALWVELEPIAGPYEPPPPPPYEVRRAQWLETAAMNMAEFQAHLAGIGEWDTAKDVTETMPPIWQVWWLNAGQTMIRRNSDTLADFVRALGHRQYNKWLDSLPLWNIEQPEKE